ncbi:DUF2490 domain-containing protein [Francisella uliginis]|uniref:DUF2490 domain-containing protein n=1 Tax=Francisella uliginis TaxID=573570 RepID=A0A1L4BUA0_9GAMM|nr:DUF2490 domain-containing protein [Francisella uliginis]API87420.1 hypothetical protein F7310_08630 [Francisella uliginis]
MKKLLYIIGFYLIALNSAKAVNSDNFQSWNNITVLGNLGFVDDRYSKILYEITYQERLANASLTSFQTLYRGGLGYSLNSKHSLWVGADYLVTRNLVPEEVNTNAIWQQYLYKDDYKELKYLFRARFEQLLISSANYLTLRVRLMIRGSYPISENKKWSIIGFNEYFQNLNGDGVVENASLIQNRAFAGFGYSATKNTNIELGYMNQFIHSSQRNDFMANILLVSLVFNFN